jgi:hypothetical protein
VESPTPRRSRLARQTGRRHVTPRCAAALQWERQLTVHGPEPYALRRAIQRYIEDPLADEVLSRSMPPGSTVEVDKAPEDDERDVTISIIKPKHRKRETVGVGAQGDAREEGSSTDPSSEDAPELPDEPEVLPDVPDAPPAPEGDAEDK